MISLSQAVPPRLVAGGDSDDEEEPATMADVLSALPQAKHDCTPVFPSRQPGDQVPAAAAEREGEAAEGTVPPLPDPLLTGASTEESDTPSPAVKPASSRPSAESPMPPAPANQATSKHSAVEEAAGGRSTVDKVLPESRRSGAADTELKKETGRSASAAEAKSEAAEPSPVRLATYEPRGMDSQTRRSPGRKLSSLHLALGLAGLSAFAVVSWFAYNVGVDKGDKATEQVVITPTHSPGGLLDRIPPDEDVGRGTLASGAGSSVADGKASAPVATGEEPRDQSAAGAGQGKPVEIGRTATGSAKPLEAVVAPQPPKTPATAKGFPTRVVSALTKAEKSEPHVKPALVAGAVKIASTSAPAGTRPTPNPDNVPASKPKPSLVNKPQAKPVLPAPEALAAVKPAAGRPGGSQPGGSQNSKATMFAVQMASVRSEAAAKAEWARLKKAHGTLLSGVSLDVQQATVKNKGTYYRIRAAGLDSRAAAKALCDKLKAARQGCLVVRR